MSAEILTRYRAMKQSNPFAAAQFRRTNAHAIRTAEEAERPTEHAAEIAERQKQTAAIERERLRARGGVRDTAPEMQANDAALDALDRQHKLGKYADTKGT